MLQKLVWLLFIIVSFKPCFSQTDHEILKPFVRSFTNAFSIPNQWVEDTCASRIFMLKISVRKGVAHNFALSDSAPELFKSELKRIAHRIDTKPLITLCKEKKFKSIDLLFPVFFISPDYPCNQHNKAPEWINDDYTSYDGKQLAGAMYLGEPIAIKIWAVLRKEKSNIY